MKETKNSSKCKANFPDLHHRREAHVLCPRLVLLKNPAWADVPAHQTSNCRGMDQIEVDFCYQQLETHAPNLGEKYLVQVPLGLKNGAFRKECHFVRSCYGTFHSASTCRALQSRAHMPGQSMRIRKELFNFCSFIAMATSLLLHLHNLWLWL